MRPRVIPFPPVAVLAVLAMVLTLGMPQAAARSGGGTATSDRITTSTPPATTAPITDRAALTPLTDRARSTPPVPEPTALRDPWAQPPPGPPQPRELAQPSLINPTPTPKDSPRPDSDLVNVPIDGWLSWSMLDRDTGARLGSTPVTDTSSTESMIKVWIVADYLRRTAEAGDEPSPETLAAARLAIRDSHNGTAEELYREGGGNEVVNRMIDRCELSDTHIPEHGSGWWSRTEMSARDAVRLGECLADGRAAGPEWTGWMLYEMRRVRGTTATEDQRPEEGFEGGRWGIIDVLPEAVADQVAIKNGWTRIARTGSWHVNCLAVTDDWVMAVMMRYPADYSLDYGAERCASVARSLLGSESVDSAAG